MSPILKYSNRLAVIAVAAISAGCITQQVSQSSDRLVFRYNVYDFSGNAYNKAKKQCTGTDKKLVHIETDCGFLICESAFKCVDAKQ
jgi:hypothetical protein